MLGCVLLGGCAPQDKPTAMRDDRGFLNAWTVQSMNNESVDNAILAQRTVYPYHFVAGTATLNSLGVRDLRVLAAHFRRYPGEVLNVRRADASDSLYQQRLKTVADALTAEGVTSVAAQLKDGMPGGDGVAARRAAHVVERADKPAKSDAGAGIGGASTNLDTPMVGGNH
jgi:hypothetical protein